MARCYEKTRYYEDDFKDSYEIFTTFSLLLLVFTQPVDIPLSLHAAKYP